MCACEPSFVCSRCAGTWLADDYPELPDEGEAELRYGGGREDADHDLPRVDPGRARLHDESKGRQAPVSAAQRDKGAARTCSKCGRQGSRGFRVNRYGAVVCTQAGVCTRRRSPAATPHLDEADYAARLEAQGGGCALCGAKPKNRRLDVDHDHATGAVRGLLCHRCNRALPTWVDVEWLEAACGYLGGPLP